MLSVLAKTAGGRLIAHNLSQAYPGYTPTETDAKFDHAHTASNPVRCSTIKDKTGYAGCADCAFGRRTKFSKSPVTLGTHVERKGYPLTDAGNAERFASVVRDHRRYVSHRGKWLVYNEKHWEVDTSGSVVLEVVKVLRSMRAEGAAAADFAFKCEDRRRLSAIEHIARSHLQISHHSLDQHDYLINAQNGTIDLRTGQLMPFDPAHFTTKICSADYFSGMRHPVWDNFLAEMTGGDKDLLDYLQRAVGYSATGKTTEELLFIMYGTGGTGKSTFLQTIKSVLSDYALSAESDSFIKNNKSIRNDIAKMDGKRMVITTELPHGAVFDDNIIKAATGGDEMAARFLYGETFEFIPRFKPWFSCNNRPRIRATDAAILRRLCIMGFNHIPKVRDNTLKARLMDPDVRAAVCSWIIDGAIRWCNDGGIGEQFFPACVRKEKLNYIAASDPISEFWIDCVVKESDAKLPVISMRLKYESWCRENACQPITHRTFNQIVEEKGYTRLCARVDGEYYKSWVGLRLAQ
jgi:putative DNA primase/helicase